MTEPSGLFRILRQQRALILTLSVLSVFAGLLALSRLGSGIYPEVDFPRIVVVARSGDMPPELMEASVVRPLEEALATVFGVRRLRTRIIRGSAEIALQFEEGADMWRALQFTDAAIAQTRGALPADTEIESQKVTPADFPILSYNLVGGTSLGRREAADFLVRPALSRAPGGRTRRSGRGRSARDRDHSRSPEARGRAPAAERSRPACGRRPGPARGRPVRRPSTARRGDRGEPRHLHRRPRRPADLPRRERPVVAAQRGRSGRGSSRSDPRRARPRRRRGAGEHLAAARGLRTRRGARGDEDRDRTCACPKASAWWRSTTRAC